MARKNEIKPRKTEVVEIREDRLCIGVTRLIKIAKSLYFTGLNNPHAVAKLCEEGMPFIADNKEKKFPLEDVLSWYISEKMEIEELKAVKMQAEIGRIQSQTDKLKLDYKITKKEFVSVAEVSKSQAELISFLKNQDKNSLKQEKDPAIRKKLDEHYRRKWQDTGKELEKLQERDIDSNA